MPTHPLDVKLIRFKTSGYAKQENGTEISQSASTWLFHPPQLMWSLQVKNGSPIRDAFACFATCGWAQLPPIDTASTKWTNCEVAFGPLLNSVSEYWIALQKEDFDFRSTFRWTNFGHE